MNLKITFDTGYVLECRLMDSAVVSAWADLLEQTLAKDCLLQEDTYANMLNQSQCLAKLRQAAEVVNSFMKREMVTVPDRVQDLDQTYYNQLHEQFERLSGSDYDRPTRFIQVAPAEVRTAVRLINRLCHVMEEQGNKRYFRVEFDTDRRLPLTDTRWFDWPRKNTITADYGTLGKNLLECFNDGLSPDYKAYRAQQHISANFVLRSEPMNLPWQALHAWRDSHGSTVPLDRTTLGVVELGEILDPDWFESVKKTSKINTITLE